MINGIERVGNQAEINTEKHPLEDMPSFEEHMKNLESEDFDVQSLPEKVRLPATDDFIKGIAREYFSIDGKAFCNFCEDWDILYESLRRDEKSVGEINREDMKTFIKDIKSDLREANNSEAFDKIQTTQPGFLTFKSWNLYGGERMRSDEQVHRLYVNAPADKIMDFAHKTYMQLRDDNVPFYFKIHKGNSAQKGPKDSFVLYTSTKNLGNTIKSFNKIEDKHPDLISSLNEPSMLVGRIKPWIGYGSEVSERPDNSYTGIICDAFMSAVNHTVSDWVDQHPNHMIGDRTVRQYYYDDNHELNTHRVATQKLLRVIPVVDKGFIGNFCDDTRKAFLERGLDPNNLCLTPFARKDIESNK